MQTGWIDDISPDSLSIRLVAGNGKGNNWPTLVIDAVVRGIKIGGRVARLIAPVTPNSLSRQVGEVFLSRRWIIDSSFFLQTFGKISHTFVPIILLIRHERNCGENSLSLSWRFNKI